MSAIFDTSHYAYYKLSRVHTFERVDIYECLCNDDVLLRVFLL